MVLKTLALTIEFNSKKHISKIKLQASPFFDLPVQ
jgi:hypothetical protein